MFLRKLAIISLLSISATSAFAEGGADRIMQRNLEQQQAYLEAQKAEDQKTEVAKSQPNAEPPKPQADSSHS